uniref:Uncharacterized protein n=1 Tax=Cacopsylla melanoneura TaxID=428564 RepID=A0A8D8R2U2_9HEMI
MFSVFMFSFKSVILSKFPDMNFIFLYSKSFTHIVKFFTIKFIFMPFNFSKFFTEIFYSKLDTVTQKFTFVVNIICFIVISINVRHFMFPSLIVSLFINTITCFFVN